MIENPNSATTECGNSATSDTSSSLSTGKKRRKQSNPTRLSTPIASSPSAACKKSKTTHRFVEENVISHCGKDSLDDPLSDADERLDSPILTDALDECEEEDEELDDDEEEDLYTQSDRRHGGYICIHCDSSFASEGALKSHMNEEHVLKLIKRHLLKFGALTGDVAAVAAAAAAASNGMSDDNLRPSSYPSSSSSSPPPVAGGDHLSMSAGGGGGRRGAGNDSPASESAGPISGHPSLPFSLPGQPGGPLPLGMFSNPFLFPLALQNPQSPNGSSLNLGPSSMQAAAAQFAAASRSPGQSAGSGQPPCIFNLEAYCELCNKEFCNKYFLKTHKANKHGIYTSDTPMSNSGTNGTPSISSGNGSNANGSPNNGNSPFSSQAVNAAAAAAQAFFPAGLQGSATNSSSASAASATAGNHVSHPLIQQAAVAAAAAAAAGDQQAQVQAVQAAAMAARMVGQSGSMNLESYCEICQKEFCNKYFLKKHKQKIHGINDTSISSNTSQAYQSNESQGSSMSMSPIRNEPASSGVSSSPLSPQMAMAAIQMQHQQQQQQQQNQSSQQGPMSLSSISNGGERPLGDGMSSLEAYSGMGLKEFCSKFFGPPVGNAPPPPPPPPPQVAKVPAKSKSSKSSQQQQQQSSTHATDSLFDLQQGLANSKNGVPANGLECGLKQPISPNAAAAGAGGGNSGPSQQPGKMSLAMPSPNSGPSGGPNATPILPPNPNGIPNPSPKNYCNICNKELCNKYFMKTHMLKMHGINIDEQPAEAAVSSTIGGVTCDICQKELCSKYFLKVHKQNTHGILDESTGRESNRGRKSDQSAHSNHHQLVGGTNVPSVSGITGDSGNDHRSTSHSQNHQEKEHISKGIDPKDTNNRYFSHYTEVCPLCERRFKSIKWLKTHITNDHSDMVAISRIPGHAHQSSGALVTSNNGPGNGTATGNSGHLNLSDTLNPFESMVSGLSMENESGLNLVISGGNKGRNQQMQPQSQSQQSAQQQQQHQQQQQSQHQSTHAHTPNSFSSMSSQINHRSSPSPSTSPATSLPAAFACLKWLKSHIAANEAAAAVAAAAAAASQSSSGTSASAGDIFNSITGNNANGMNTGGTATGIPNLPLSTESMMRRSESHDDANVRSTHDESSSSSISASMTSSRQSPLRSSGGGAASGIAGASEVSSDPVHQPSNQLSISSTGATGTSSAAATIITPGTIDGQTMVMENGGTGIRCIGAIGGSNVTTDDGHSMGNGSPSMHPIPTAYAIPRKPTNGPFIMQPFLITQPSPVQSQQHNKYQEQVKSSSHVDSNADSDDLNASSTARGDVITSASETFVPSLVYLPVSKKIVQPVTVAFQLTPA